MRLGVLLPSFDPLGTGGMAVAEAARQAEALGFDGVWAGEHLACHAPVLDASMTLATAAAVTSRVTVGWSVMLLALRAPAWAAKQAATLQHLSGGRAILGVGVGGEHPEEFAAAGVDVHRRGRLVDDALGVLPALLRGDPASPAAGAGGAAGDGAGGTGVASGGAAPVRGDAASGADAPEVVLRPAAEPAPPILIGGRGDVALARAARHGDGWLPMWLDPAAIAERRTRLHALAADAGRPAPTITLLLLVRVDDDVAAARAVAAEHLHAQYRLPLDVVERWAVLGPAARLSEALAQYAAVGVDETILMPLGPDPLEQYRRLAVAAGRATS